MRGTIAACDGNSMTVEKQFTDDIISYSTQMHYLLKYPIFTGVSSYGEASNVGTVTATLGKTHFSVDLWLGKGL